MFSAAKLFHPVLFLHIKVFLPYLAFPARSLCDLYFKTVLISGLFIRGWTWSTLVSCDQRTSNTLAAVSFPPRFTALEDSIIKTHLVDWNDSFPEAFEPPRSRSDQQTCDGLPLKQNDKRLAMADSSTLRLLAQRSRGRWRHFLSFQTSSAAGCECTNNPQGWTINGRVRSNWKRSYNQMQIISHTFFRV